MVGIGIGCYYCQQFLVAPKEFLVELWVDSCYYCMDNERNSLPMCKEFLGCLLWRLLVLHDAILVRCAIVVVHPVLYQGSRKEVQSCSLPEAKEFLLLHGKGTLTMLSSKEFLVSSLWVPYGFLTPVVTAVRKRTRCSFRVP